MLLIAFLAPSAARAQGSEPQPYNPCAPVLSLGPSCLDGSRSCNYPQPICSPSYCWANGVPADNQGIPPGGLVENKVIEIGGTYTITINATFKNCTFRMLGDARVNVSPVGTSLMNVKFENCDFYGCNNMWQGIVVDASGVPNGLLFTFIDGNIEDAYKGLALDEGFNGDLAQNYQITNNTFRDNHLGITNLRQVGGSLNALIRKNQFFQTANLAARVGSLIDDNDPNMPPLMPGYPIAYAGIKYVNIATTIGVNLNGEANFFRCLLNGLITEGHRSSVTSINNTFERITDRGIWSYRGYITVLGCTFGVGSGVCVFTESASLNAKTNVFGGNWEGGLHSIGNNNAQSITINNQNQFNIVGSLWEFGILVERPQALLGPVATHCTIDHNTFDVAGAVEYFTCIILQDFVDATDKAQIAWNIININSTSVPNSGIGAEMGNSDKLLIEENIITYGGVGINAPGGFGITLVSIDAFVQNTSQGHVVRHNTVSGPSAVELGPLHCAIHSASVQGIEYCDNDVDYSRWGLHFKFDCGDVALRQNHMHHHTVGLEIEGLDMPGIGPQSGRGNTWNIPNGDCIDWAVHHDVPGAFVITSPFRVPEFTNPPFRYMPHNTKISPNPTIMGPNLNWFLELAVDFDHCVPGLEGETPRKLTAYEKQLVDGLSPYTGTTLWDLKLRAYTKLLLHPELRPAGSPEAAFLNGLANTTISSFGQVVQMMGSSLAMSASDQQSFDNYNTSTQQAAENLTAWDASQNYSSTNNLTVTWFANRMALLQQMATNAANKASLEASRNAQVSANLQNALAYNTSISTSQPYEVARKALHDIWLRRLLHEPMTQTYYQQILALAQQDPASSGQAARAAANFVAPCDRYLFPYTEDEGGEAQRGSGRDKEEKAIGTVALRLTPNPSTGQVEVSMPPNIAASFVVMNAYGQPVRKVEIAEGTRSISLDLTQLPSGLYWGVLLNAQGRSIAAEAISLHR